MSNPPPSPSDGNRENSPDYDTHHVNVTSPEKRKITFRTQKNHLKHKAHVFLIQLLSSNFSHFK